MYAKYLKRILDFILSLIALMILSPVFLIIAIAIKIDSKGPVFFLQERLGKNGKVFKIIKFRTMVVNAEHMGAGIKVTGENDDRITKLGRRLRKFSLDEVPQLINVIKGDMSLIGPRPPLTTHPHKYEEYSKKQKKRFLVRPGITGMAQIKYRNSATWDTRIQEDVKYINKVTFISDVKILFITILNVISKRNVYASSKSEGEKDRRKVRNEKYLSKR